MRITELAERTRADADLVAARARQLRDIRARLIGRDGVPEWFDAEITAHIDRCTRATADLTAAAERLGAHAGSGS